MQGAIRGRPQTGLELVQAWRENLQARGYKPSTLKHYPRIAADWCAFIAARTRQYDSADVDDVDAFIHLYSSTGRKPWSIRCALCACRNWYKWLKRRHFVADNPFDSTEPIRAEPHIPNPMTESQVRSLIEAEPHPLYRALWEVLYSTGARISSIMALRPEDLDLEKGRAFMRTAKRGRGSIQPLGLPAREALRTYLIWRAEELDRSKLSSEWLWIGVKKGGGLSGRPTIHADAVRDRLARAAKRVGITEPVTPHRFRHSAATHLLDHGANLREVQEFLVHDSIQATQIYTLVSPGRLEESFRKAHPRA